MVTGKTERLSNVLFTPKPNDICHILKKGTKFTLSTLLLPTIRNLSPYSNSVKFVTTFMGKVVIGWTPIPMETPKGISTNIADKFEYNHGPLPIPDSQPIYCHGPTCYIESTPFDASIEIDPPMPKVSIPFQVRYIIGNKTNLHQHLKITMHKTGNGASSNGMLISGLLNGELCVGPMETKILSYSILVTRVGKTSLPKMNISSVRYNSWVIYTTDDNCITITY